MLSKFKQLLVKPVSSGNYSRRQLDRFFIPINDLLASGNKFTQVMPDGQHTTKNILQDINRPDWL